jgi:hypothetical protein
MGISWWRMAFIFGPAIARGDISSFSLYTPFIFGTLLTQRALDLAQSTSLPTLCFAARVSAAPWLCGSRELCCLFPLATAGSAPCAAHFDGMWHLTVWPVLTRTICVFSSVRPCVRASVRPCVFPGHLLSRVVRNWKSQVKLRGWPHKVGNRTRKKIGLSSATCLHFISNNLGSTLCCRLRIRKPCCLCKRITRGGGAFSLADSFACGKRVL